MRVDPNYISNLSSSLSQSTLQEATLTNELVERAAGDAAWR